MFVSEVPGVIRGRPGRQVPPSLAAKVRPVSSPGSRVLALAAALVPLFPDGALRRGSTTVVAARPGQGGTTLGLSLLAGASAGGRWCATVGVADPGVVAMTEIGLDLRRVVFVPRPKAGWADAAGELLNGVDVVLVRPPGRGRPTASRHLSARARERQAALVVLVDRREDWGADADLVLSVSATEWRGAGPGQGHLRGRRAEIRVSGRRAGPRPAVHSLWMPSGEGTVTGVAAPPDRPGDGGAPGVPTPGAAAAAPVDPAGWTGGTRPAGVGVG